MVKHTQTIRRQFADELFEFLTILWGWRLKGWTHSWHWHNKDRAWEIINWKKSSSQLSFIRTREFSCKHRDLYFNDEIFNFQKEFYIRVFSNLRHYFKFFIFTLLFSASKGFIKALKGFIKRFEAPQRSVNIKIYVKIYVSFYFKKLLEMHGAGKVKSTYNRFLLF